MSFTGLPRVLQVAVAAGSLIAEVARVNTVALALKLDPLFGGDLVPIDGFVAAVPDRENDAPFRGAVDLHAEISPVPAAGHVEGGHRFFNRGDFAIKGGDGVGRSLVTEVNRSRVAPLLEIEVGPFDGGTL